MTTPEGPGGPQYGPPAPQRPASTPSSYPGTPAGYTPTAYQPFTPPLPPAPGTPIGLAVSALVVGIVAFLTGWIPFWGFVAGGAAVGLGIFALLQRQSKGLSIAGIALGGLAVIVSLVMTISLVSFIATGSGPEEAPGGGSGQQTDEPDDAAPEEVSEEETPVEEEPEPEPAPEPVVPVTPDLSTFVTIEDRALALLAKDPEAHVGENLVLFGEVTQLDSFTGKCGVRMDLGASQSTDAWDYEHNTLLSAGDGEMSCPVLDPIVQGDHLKVWVTIVGVYEYDTTLGGTATAIWGQLWQAEVLPEL